MESDGIPIVEDEKIYKSFYWVEVVRRLLIGVIALEIAKNGHFHSFWLISCKL